MAKGTFGEHLKREREMRGVSLEEISAATRISTRFLEALENEKWDRLPGGVFNRGFVRAVAHFLGLDEESLVAEYALAHDDRPSVAIWAIGAGSHSSGTRWLTLLVLLLLVAGIGGWFGWKRYAGWRAGRAAAASRSDAPAAQAAPAQPGETKPVAPASEPAMTPASAQSATDLTGSTPTAAGPDTSEATTLELTVSAGKTTSVSVIADGKTVFDAKMKAGESRHFRAQEHLEVSSRDSSALLLELNGQTVPPLGLPGRPGSVTLTRKDLKKPPGGLD